MVLVLAAVLAGDLLLPWALLRSTAFCTAGKAAITAVAERAAEAPAEAAVLTAVEATFEAPLEVEATAQGESEATTAVALDASDA
jgi:hypothetical protein